MAGPLERRVPGGFRRLSVVQFARVVDVPPKAQGFANLASVQTLARMPKRFVRLHGVHCHCPARGIAHRHAHPHILA
ncbi:hypothetical protein [Polaromonas glacialis]|uniref:hypothetical protein n=1 Tax=Polaromonas glacialis TaxID=866564 RepID=UPI0012EC39CE|nr:hypothetical protein [Polaromonas glacialis]